MEGSSEKTSELPSRSDCESGRGDVKGQDERHRTAPLTSPRPPREPVRIFPLTGVDAVIHGAPRFINLPYEMWATRLEDIAETETIFTTLMGEDVEARRKFIEDNALDVKNLDI